MGTNQHRAPDREEMTVKYFEALDRVYKGIPTLVLTPLWRWDPTTDIKMLREMADIIRRECAKHPNIKVVDGFELVPNVSDYSPDGVHPNALGSELYGNNLVRKIKELKF